jgi:hypothetical protein
MVSWPDSSKGQYLRILRATISRTSKVLDVSTLSTLIVL